MEKKLSRIATFVENLPVVSDAEEIVSTVLSSGTELLGAGTTWTNGGDCQNYIACGTSSNAGNCKNYNGVCGAATNGKSCVNYPKDENIYGPTPNANC